MTVLSKTYSRDRTIIHAFLWDESDRMGYEKYLQYDLKYNLFVWEGETERLNVYFNNEEQADIERQLAEKLNSEPNTFEEMKSEFIFYWDKIYPYLTGDKSVKSFEELQEYYNNAVKWWSVMNLYYFIPNIDTISQSIKNECLEARTKAEKYSDVIDDITSDYWKNNVSEYKNLAPVISPHEIFQYGYTGLSDEKLKGISTRLKGCFFLKNEIYPIQQLEKILQENNLELESIKTSGNTDGILKGSVASQGYGVGNAIIVEGKKDLPRVKDGDILVTAMTSPDYVPAMKRASAIVTDEGGITSHAAIASRELGKPCIIGTKHATQVLNDGDEVEVDAERGVVTVMNRAEKKQR